MSDKKYEKPIFIDGLRAFKPNDKAPEFILANLQFDKIKLIEWLSVQEKDKINVDVKRSKEGKYYCAVNTFVPTTEGLIDNQKIPF